MIAELNRVGIMIDVSHPSKASMMQALAAVEGADHRLAFGGARALQSQPQPGRRAAARAEEERRRRADRGVRELREVDRLRRSAPRRSTRCARNSACRPARWRAAGGAGGGAGAAAAGGAAAGGGRHRRAAAGPARSARRGRRARAAQPRKRAELDKRVAEINAKSAPPPRATVKDFVDHIDYIVKKIGIDHVGISSDFDGGGGVDGWNDASETFNVTLELVRRGYTEEQIGKIWSGNRAVPDEMSRTISAEQGRDRSESPTQKIRGETSAAGPLATIPARR